MGGGSRTRIRIWHSSMSDSLIFWKPRIDEPSKPILRAEILYKLSTG